MPFFSAKGVACEIRSRVHYPSVKSNICGILYPIPYNCGQVYIGETRQRLETRVKEHWDACKKGMTDNSAVVKHTWENCHPVHCCMGKRQRYWTITGGMGCW